MTLKPQVESRLMELSKIVSSALKGAAGMFLQDLEAIPEEAFFRKFAPKARTVADMVYEVNLVNDHIGTVIRGETPFDWPEGGWITAPISWRTKEQVIEAYKLSSDKIVATAAGFSEEELEGKVQTDHGETTRYERFRFITSHLWYHSGQLNYIQTLLGDDAWHWS